MVSDRVLNNFRKYTIAHQVYKDQIKKTSNAQVELNKNMEKAVEISKKNKEEVRELVKTQEGITKRTKILNTVIAANNGQLNLGAKTLKEYRLAGGTTFEYLATFMKSAKEEVRLFGMEAAAARRIMYGFMPRGAFRLINQLATSFDAVGAAMRGIRDGGEGADSMLTTFLKVTRKLPSFSDVSKTFSFSDSYSGLGIQSPIGQKLSEFKEQATKKRQERKESIKAFFKSPKWREVGKTMSFLGKGVVQNLAKFLFMAMLYMVLITVAIAALRKPIQKGLEFVFEIFKAAWPLISEGFSDIFDGIFGIYESLISGDILGIIEGFWTIAWGVIQVAFGIFSALLVGIITFVVGVVLGILETAKDFIMSFFDFSNYNKKMLGKLVIVAVAVLAFIYGFPVIIAAVALTAFVVLAKMIGKAIKSSLGFKATGGIVTNDMTVVGERGPELVSLPKGSRVHSNSESRRMTGGVVNNYNITINAKDTSKAEMRRIADEIGRMVSSKINRRTSHRSSV